MIRKSYCGLCLFFMNIMKIFAATTTNPVANKTISRWVAVTDEVWFDIKIGDEMVGRIEMGMFGEIVPKTTKNFIALAKEHTKGEGYKGSKFHRVIRGFVAQGGDFQLSNGRGGKSIYGKHFEDENFNVRHAGAGFLSMANRSMKNSNSSQFFFTLNKTPWLDGKHVVFGKVVKGMKVIRKIEASATNKMDTPIKDIVIVDCGVKYIDIPYRVELVDAID